MAVRVRVLIDAKHGVESDSVIDAIKMMSEIEMTYNPVLRKSTTGGVVDLYMRRVKKRYKDAGGSERIDIRSPESFLISCVSAGVIKECHISSVPN